MQVDSLLSLITEPSWKSVLEEKLNPDAFSTIECFLNDRIKQGAIVFPPQAQWFRAINDLPLDQVKVVIVGQDPYHGEGQAQGLSFSVPSNCKVPPSLRNMFKEIATDCGVHNQTGNLERWVAQGVLLINASLTVEKGLAGSHQECGWETITDAIISTASQRLSHCVFLLWGGFAHKKAQLIDESQHLILQAPHPSPLSAYRGWFGCRHFSRTNDYLTRNNRSAIDWRTDEMHQEVLI